MPTLDGVKAALTDHLASLIKNVVLGASGSEASSRDSGAGNAQMTATPSIQRIDDRTLSFTAIFDTRNTAANSVKEVVLHGETSLDNPAYRASFLPITKDSTNEIRVDVLMEVR